MSTATLQRPNVKPRCREKPPQPVHGVCRWINRPQLPYGLGRLSINGTEYDTECHVLDERVIGVRLVKDDDTAYDLDCGGEFFSCTCGDGCYRPNRPGGCKHVRACQVAGLLPAVPLAVQDRIRHTLAADGLLPTETEDRPATGTPARPPAFRSLGDAMRNSPESFACDEHDPA
jgi:hypothetical protein